MLQMQSLFGLFAFIFIAYLFSNNRNNISWKTVGLGLSLQIVLALLVLGVPKLGFKGPLQWLFIIANDGILKVLSFTQAGSSFMLGPLADSSKSGFIIVFQILPIIIFLSSLMAVLYHIGIMQWIVHSFALVMQKTLKLSGAESLAAAANVFVGQTEAPLIIRPYLNKLTSSELFAVMTGGMATIAGSVMAAYVGLLKDVIPNIGGHLLTASILSAPAALIIAKIMVPETQIPETLGKVPREKSNEHINIIEAAANGASDGMRLAVNVGAMLLAFVALIAMVDALFISLGEWIQFETWGVALTPEFQLAKGPPQLSLAFLFSWLFKPMAFLMGIPAVDTGMAGVLIGKKIVFNEFIAYLDLAQSSESLNPRSSIILSYALCGFANFSSIAIQIGGIGPLVPQRKKEIALFGLRSVIGGSLAAFMTACLAGMLI